MKIIKKYILVLQCCLLLTGLLRSSPLNAQDARFTVVIDAGHGGHDPGAMGSVSREKDINLAVALNLGSIIGKNFDDVKVIYTRKTDLFLPLQERADIVNNHHADLFICVHTNASSSASAYGAETFTLGLAKSKANLDVAMRENSVILLEENYRTKYKGFDPNSVDSYIMFEFMQDKYIDKSVEFSSIIQKQFVNYGNRVDRGVRQAGFWVLHRSACPSVLVELGFISNPEEERYLNSSHGQNEMATAIFNAFVIYKRDHDKRSGRQISTVQIKGQPERTIETIRTEKVLEVDSTKPVKDISAKIESVSTPKNNDQVPVFKVQLFATTKLLKAKAPALKGIKNTDYFKEGGLYKYTLGNETDYSKIEKVKKEIHSKFPQAFIIAFVGDKKISAQEALK